MKLKDFIEVCDCYSDIVVSSGSSDLIRFSKCELGLLGIDTASTKKINARKKEIKSFMRNYGKYYVTSVRPYSTYCVDGSIDMSAVINVYISEKL